MKRKILLVAALAMVAVNLQADTPVLVSLVDPVQIPSRSSTVDGLEIGLLMGRCDNLNGIGVGTSVMVDAKMNGLMVSLAFNWNSGGGNGLSAALVFNRLDGLFRGVQYAVGANICEGEFRGLQYSAWASNYASRMRGAQYGIVNLSHDCCGLQLGIVNMTEEMSGVQIGILNFIRNSPLPFFPILNAHF